MNPIKPASLTVIILTFNEEKHLRRCIESVRPLAERIVVVDSFSTDRTLDIAAELGAEVLQNPFVTQAKQFQWTLDHCPITTDWVMQLDADEYCFPELLYELSTKLAYLPNDVTGLLVKRRVYFMDRWIRRGYYPMWLLRIWRNGKGRMLQKWMDEHMVLTEGRALPLEHDMADHNLNQLTWWTAKHNGYATREAIERLNRKHRFLPVDAATKQVRWYKSLYMGLPLFVRPFLYFFYRYIVRGGFLEGKEGLIWHTLQGFWCQFLIDAKIYQIEHHARTSGRTIREVIEQDFGIALS